MRYISQFIALLCAIAFCVVSTGQQLPIITDVTELSKNSRNLDGHLVQVKAWLVFGWEGDNFLFDSMKPAPRKPADFRAASVWFYCNPSHQHKVCDTVQFGGTPVLGTFKGYFHFVPNQKSRKKDVFDPGPLQLEVIEISDLLIETTPSGLGLTAPHD